jgi:hypothetical protein
MEWRPIKTAPEGVAVLVIDETWEHADVCMMDECGFWYSPVDGTDVMPQPTYWISLRDLPDLPT